MVKLNLVFFTGISVADEKPDFHIFLKPIINELRALEYVINFDMGNNKFNQIHFFVLFGVFDKPARAAVLNMINSTGYSSCLKCLQKGDVVLG